MTVIDSLSYQQSCLRSELPRAGRDLQPGVMHSVLKSSVTGLLIGGIETRACRCGSGRLNLFISDGKQKISIYEVNSSLMLLI